MFRKSILFFILALALVPASLAQTTPEMSVNGVRLGDRDSGRKFLLPYLPTTDDRGRAAYYFFNDLGTLVMKMTAASMDDPFMIVEITVFSVGTGYKTPHLQLEKVGNFITESEIFIGVRPNMVSTIIGIPNLDRKARIGPKDLIKLKGEPTKRVKDGGQDLYTYEIPNIEIADEKGVKTKFDYSGTYEFHGKTLNRFVLSIRPPATNP